MAKFKGLRIPRIHNPSQPVFTLDHNVQDHSTENRKKYADIRAFAKKHGVDAYPAGRGIGHQIMVEEGYAFPGQLVVASDSHSNMYGGIGCLGTPVVRTDAAAIWATGYVFLFLSLCLAHDYGYPLPYFLTLVQPTLSLFSRQTWWRVPPVTRVILEGHLRPGVTGKDVIVALCGHFNQDEVSLSPTSTSLPLPILLSLFFSLYLSCSYYP